MNVVRLKRGDLANASTLLVERVQGTIVLRRGARLAMMMVLLIALVGVMVGVVWWGTAGDSAAAARDTRRMFLGGGIVTVLIVGLLSALWNRNLRDMPPELVIDPVRRRARVKGMALDVDLPQVKLRLTELIWRVAVGEDGQRMNTRITVVLLGVATSEETSWTVVGGFSGRATRLAHRLRHLAPHVTLVVDRLNLPVFEKDEFELLV